MNVIQYASAIEMFQLAVAILGLGFAAYAVWLYVVAAVDLADAPPGDLRRLIALSDVTREMFRCLSQLILVVVGVISVLLPPPTGGLPDVNPEMQQSLLVRLGLVTLTVVLAADTVVSQRLRAKFFAGIRNRSAEATPVELKARDGFTL